MKIQGSLSVVRLGGNAYNGTNAGTFYLNANNTSSNSNVNIDSESCTKIKNINCPYHQGKIHYYTPLHIGTSGEDLGATRL